VLYRTVLAIAFFASVALCERGAGDDNAQPASSNAVPPPESKHIFFVIPNFRTSATLASYKPLTTRRKFRIAAQDSFDRGTVALAALFAGQSQLSNANRSFGQGVQGYSKYFGAAYSDFVTGNYMTEGIFPTLLHQDPRYFRKGTGSALSRLGYSIGQSFWTHRDSGGTEFNYSEVLGNSAAVAISNIYYKDGRTAHNAISQLEVQIGVDTATNVMKEFWPDVGRRFGRKHLVASEGR